MREILINVTPRETRAALVQDGVLQELYVERANRRGLVGNLYLGRVERVLPGMQAAFVELGLERTAFLHVSDVAVDGAAVDADDAAETAIDELLKQGDELLVQVLKDPIGTKGARLSTFVSLPSRFLVHLPRGSGVGVSARINDETERERLRQLVGELAAEHGGGYIVRTAAAEAPHEALRADMLYLARLWEHLRGKRAAARAGELLHGDLPLSTRMLRDELGPEVARVLVDDADECEQMRAFANAFMPDKSAHIELHTDPRPIFSLHGIEDEITRALERKVPLKSGGYAVFDQTESMTTVDVNTGGYVGARTLEDTIFRTNMEAATVIARQLRLRNLGGIIIVDFIDMESETHRAQLLEAFRDALAADRAQTHIVGVSELGLVEMTRKRTRESLGHLLCQPCDVCQGRGFIKSAETVCHEIYREVLRAMRQRAQRSCSVLAHPEVVELLLDEEAPVMAALAAQLGRPVRLQAETQYALDQFDIVPLGEGVSA